MSEDYLALMLHTRGRRCLVVGGGEVARRKVEDALHAGLAVVVVAPRVVPALRDLARLGRITWEERVFHPADVRGMFLTFAAATPEVNDQACQAARQAGVLVNVVDHPEMSDFISPAVLQRGPVTVAVSTGGASPALAARIRDRVATVVDEETGEWATLLARFRRRVQEAVAEAGVRHELLRRAAELEGEAAIARGERTAVERLLDSWLEPYRPASRHPGGGASGEEREDGGGGGPARQSAR
ncbi:MAG: bifunctional precorrin-2 dehydrogenase/sirohydrochlorin ferrochelatase [Bacillota bacterium]|nr:bifunctional precorrin-2 dehydrogenase/sirohydrochlorin ferrochelatase [Bacillota bacterium]